MKRLFGLVGVIALIAAVGWTVSPLARWRLSRLAGALVALAVALSLVIAVCGRRLVRHDRRRRRQ